MRRSRSSVTWSAGITWLRSTLPRRFPHDDRRSVRKRQRRRVGARGDREERVADRADGAGEAALFAADGQDAPRGQVGLVERALGAGEAADELEAALLEL